MIDHHTRECNRAHLRHIGKQLDHLQNITHIYNDAILKPRDTNVFKECKKLH